MSISRYATLIVIVVLATSLQAQTASLRQQQIFVGDIAELRIALETNIPSLYAIDTAPLQGDFEVLDKRSSVSRVVQANQNLNRMEWTLYLLPRRTGRLQIPALKFGKYLSSPLWLNVRQPDADMRERQNIFAEIEAIPPNPYPGQQTRIVMRLLHNLPVLEAKLIEPKFIGAQVFRGDTDLTYETTRDGKVLSVLERSMLITPDSPGPMQLAGASFSGVIEDPIATASEPDEAAAKRRIFRRSQPLQLQVRELPPGSDPATWLPASRLALALQWDELDGPPRVGDSLGLTVTLRASGLPGDDLPASLLLREPGQLRIFADRETRATEVRHAARDLNLSGQLLQRYVIILDQAGKVTLPQLRLPWWDVNADMARVEVLQPESVNVIAGDSGASLVATPGAAGVASHGQIRGLLALPLQDYWPWFALLLVGILLPLSRRLRQRLTVPLAGVVDRYQCRRHLRQACYAGDANAAHPALLAWARNHWQDRQLHGLNSIAQRTQALDWREQLAWLDAARFAADAEDWSGEALWKLVQTQSRRRAGRRQLPAERLPELYPAANDHRPRIPVS